MKMKKGTCGNRNQSKNRDNLNYHFFDIPTLKHYIKILDVKVKFVITTLAPNSLLIF
jgi:hypothetical protein